MAEKSRRVREMLDRMTPEERFHIMVGAGLITQEEYEERVAWKRAKDETAARAASDAPAG